MEKWYLVWLMTKRTLVRFQPPQHQTIRDMIKYQKEIIEHLGIPNIPKRPFDGKSFDKGVAVVELLDGSLAYAVCKYNSDTDGETPRITKTFGLEPFAQVKEYFVVPSYMTSMDEIDNMDLDEESKKHAKLILNEAKDLENEETLDEDTGVGEYYFDHIHNDEEAKAYIASYNKTNKLKRARVPKTHDGLIMRLAAIYSEQKSANNGK